MSTIWTSIFIWLKLILPTLLIYKLNKKKMRYIDGLQQPCKDSFLKLSIAYAKGEINELNLPATTNVHDLALDYCHQYGCIMGDLAPFNPLEIVAWGGSRPVKVPR